MKNLNQPVGCRIANHVCQVLLVIALIIISDAKLFSQWDPTKERGLKPYGTFEGGAIDSISTTNGALNLHIPIVAYAQRGGKLEVSFYVNYLNGTYAWTTSSNPECTQAPFVCSYGRSERGSLVKFASDLNVAAFAYTSLPNDGPYGYVNTPDGSSHSLAKTADGLRTYDSSGYLCLNNCATLIDANGIRYTVDPTSHQPKIEDLNGNFIQGNVDSSGNTVSYTDTLGRNIPVPPDSSPSYRTILSADTTGCTGPLPTVGSVTWSVPGYQGNPATYKVCYAKVYFGARECAKDGSRTTCGVPRQ